MLWEDVLVDGIEVLSRVQFFQKSIDVVSRWVPVKFVHEIGKFAVLLLERVEALKFIYVEHRIGDAFGDFLVVKVLVELIPCIGEFNSACLILYFFCSD